ncbi:unnamed protein product [Caenorhabditis nigoni]
MSTVIGTMSQDVILASLENSANTVEVGSTSLPKRNPSQGESVGNYIVNAIKSEKQVLFFLKQALEKQPAFEKSLI